jgi:hypothetical protein
MKQVVVVNVSNKDLPIPELRKIVPAGLIDEKYVLPYDVAIKYKQYLYPVGIIEEQKDIKLIPKGEDNKVDYVEKLSDVELEQKRLEEEDKIKTKELLKKKRLENLAKGRKRKKLETSKQKETVNG